MLRTIRTINLSTADAIANASIASVSKLIKHKPMTVTVLDAAGGILVQKRMDGCPDGAYSKFSYAKAKTCILLQTSSGKFREKYTSSGEAPAFTQAASMVSLMGGELIPIAGGVLILDKEGNTIGSVGVSGAAAAEDEYLAWKGVHDVIGSGGAKGLTTIPENHSCTTLN